MPYCFGSLGMYAASRNQSEAVTALYLSAVKKILPEAVLNKAIERNTAGFGVVRANFAAAMETYQNCGRKLAQETLHLIFFVPRGADNGVIHIDIKARIDDVHEMLGLQKGQALIDSTHPLHREYSSPVGGGPLRFFPVPGRSGTTIAKPLPDSETHQFLEALGKCIP